MKTIFASFTIFFCITVVLGCYSQRDCKEGHCCTGGITPWLKGSCEKLAEEGKLCDPNPPVYEKYFLKCPCEQGLECISTKEVISNDSPLCMKVED